MVKLCLTEAGNGRYLRRARAGATRELNVDREVARVGGDSHHARADTVRASSRGIRN